MPLPVSRWRSRHSRRRPARVARVAGSGGTARQAKASVPPSGIASRALMAMLSSADSSWPGSASTGGQSGAASTSMRTRWSSVRRSMSVSDCSSAATSTRAGLQHLAAREREQLAGQLGAAPGGARGRADELLAARCPAAAGSSSQHLQVALDDGEQVVEVVRDAAGELADALEPLRMRSAPLPLARAAGSLASRLHSDSQEVHLVVAEALRLARAHGQQRRSCDRGRTAAPRVLLVDALCRGTPPASAKRVSCASRPQHRLAARGPAHSRAACRAGSAAAAPSSAPASEPDAGGDAQLQAVGLEQVQHRAVSTSQRCARRSPAPCRSSCCGSRESTASRPNCATYSL